MSSIHDDLVPRRARTIEPASATDERGAAADGVEGEGIAAALLAGVAAAGEMDRPAGTHVVPEYPLEDPPPEIDVDTIVDADGNPVAHAGAAERLDRLATLPDEPPPLPDQLGGDRLATDVDEEDPDGPGALYEAALDEAVLDEP